MTPTSYPLALKLSSLNKLHNSSRPLGPVNLELRNVPWENQRFWHIEKHDGSPIFDLTP